MIKAALVLEGGALRGMYTSGVLDTFLKNNMEFECVAGVCRRIKCNELHIKATGKISKN